MNKIPLSVALTAQGKRKTREIERERETERKWKKWKKIKQPGALPP